MPIYEYRCQQCGREFEQLVRSSNARIKCPNCAGRRVRRKLSVFAMSSSSKESALPVSRSGCGCCHASSCAGCRK